jgi:glycine reductase
VDTLVYGKDVGGFIPTVINPLSAIDGGIECLSCRISAHRPSTFYHQNNPSIIEALRRHGKELNFAGVLISLHENMQSLKEKNAFMCFELMKNLRLNCAAIIEENKGNPDVDLMLVCRLAEKAGIKIVLLTDESAGEDGLSQGMADIIPEADAIVTNGNCNFLINIKPMGKVIGDSTYFGKISGTSYESLQPDGSYNVELLCIPSACNQMGYSALSCIEV